MEFALWQEDAPPLHPWHEWQLCCMALSLQDAYRQLETWGLLRGGEFVNEHFADVSGRKRGNLQACLLSAISPLMQHEPRFEQVLRPRADRWHRLGLVTVPPGIACRRAQDTLNSIWRNCPPCVVWAVVRTWMNGWCTGRCFQCSREHSCVLSRDCSGEDSIEHYLCCSVVRAVALRKLHLRAAAGCPSALLLLDGDYPNETQAALAATLLYAVYTNTNRARHSKSRPSAEHSFDDIWCGVRRAGMQSRKLSKLVKEIWAQ